MQSFTELHEKPSLAPDDGNTALANEGVSLGPSDEVSDGAAEGKKEGDVLWEVLVGVGFGLAEEECYGEVGVQVPETSFFQNMHAL